MLNNYYCHKKTNAGSFEKSRLKMLLQIIAVAVTLTIFSSLASDKVFANSYTDSDSSFSEDEILIPESYRDDVLKSLGRTGGSITEADLESINKLELLMTDNRK